MSSNVNQRYFTVRSQNVQNQPADETNKSYNANANSLYYCFLYSPQISHSTPPLLSAPCRNCRDWCCSRALRLNLSSKFISYKLNKRMSIKAAKKLIYTVSCGSTEGDSSSEEREDQLVALKTNPLKHKTELCKNYSETGRCPYGKKCRFAHGEHQRIAVRISTSFRKKRCNNFHQNGFCSYGVRCQFSHHEVNWQAKAILIGMASIMSEDHQKASKLTQIIPFRK